MKIKTVLLVLLLFAGNAAFAQIGCNNDGSQPDPSAGLDVKFPDKGLLIPRVALVQTSSPSPVTVPANSLLVYNTATANDITPGYYYWNDDSSTWVRLSIFSGGSGTTNYVTKWATDGTLGNSQLFDDGTNVGIGNAIPGAKLDVAGGNIRTDQQLVSTMAEGTAPLAVTSTTLVSNLNADLLDGMHASEFALASSNGNNATYRWATFTTYTDGGFWACDNNQALFGGVTPSNWTNGSALASQMSSDKEILRTLFTQKGYAKGNATIMNEDYIMYSSTNGKVVMALFRINNTTGSIINWTPNFYFSAYDVWGEKASVALNGGNSWSSSSSGSASVTLPIPANRVSTVIFVSTSGSAFTMANSLSVRNCRLAFYNNSLLLPSGLEFIDDLDTATGGWSQ